MALLELPSTINCRISSSRGVRPESRSPFKDGERETSGAVITSRSVRRYFSKLAPECQPQLSSEFVSLGRGPLVDSPRLIEPEPFQLVAEDCVQLAPNVVAYGSTGW